MKVTNKSQHRLNKRTHTANEHPPNAFVRIFFGYVDNLREANRRQGTHSFALTSVPLMSVN